MGLNVVPSCRHPLHSYPHSRIPSYPLNILALVMPIFYYTSRHYPQGILYDSHLGANLRDAIIVVHRIHNNLYQYPYPMVWGCHYDGRTWTAVIECIGKTLTLPYKAA